jgi:SulP family sulfate permease
VPVDKRLRADGGDYLQLLSSSGAGGLFLDALRRLEEVHLLTLAVGSAGFVVLILLRRWRPAFPWALVVVLAATVLVAGLSLEDHGIKVVGDIPRSLPAARAPSFDLDRLQRLLPLSFAVTLVALIESLAMAKYFASRNGYRVSAGGEFVALGTANATAGLFQGYPVAGSFSRTAVNAATGARTPIAGLITAGVIGITLVAAAPLFRSLPKAVLASVVFMAATSLVDVGEARRLWRVKRADFYLMALAFWTTLLLGIERGILIAVVASLLVVLSQTARPHTAVLGRVPGTTNFRNVDRSPGAVTIPGVIVLRVDAPLYFANAEFLAETLQEVESASPDRLRVMILDFSSVTDLDSSADGVLSEIADDYAARGVEFYLANVKGIILDVMRRSGFYLRLGPARFFFSTHEAVGYAEDLLETREIVLGAEPPVEPRARRAPAGTALDV